MRHSLEGQSTILVFALVTVGALALWAVLLFLLWGILTLAGLSVDLRTLSEGLSTAVTAAAVLSAGYAAYRELSELSTARHIDVADELFKELNAPESVEARRWIFRNLPDDPEEGLRTLSAEGQATIKRVLNSLDRVAFLTQAGWIPERMIMPWMNPMVVKVWAKLGPYVEYEGRRRHEPDYYEQARELAERCVAWRRERLPGAEVTWVEDAL
jgi:hypothetical protein